MSQWTGLSIPPVARNSLNPFSEGGDTHKRQLLGKKFLILFGSETVQRLFLGQLTTHWHVSKIYIQFVAFGVSEICFYEHEKARNIAFMVKRNILLSSLSAEIFLARQRCKSMGTSVKTPIPFKY